MKMRRYVSLPGFSFLHLRALVYTVSILALFASLLSFFAFSPLNLSFRGEAMETFFAKQPERDREPRSLPTPSVTPQLILPVQSELSFELAPVEETEPFPWPAWEETSTVEIEDEPLPKPSAAPRRKPAIARSSVPSQLSSAGTADVFTPPAYRIAPVPPYPASMRQSGVEGRVRLRIFLDAQGRPQRVVVVQSSGYAEFDSTAGDWVLRHWSFTPAQRGDKAVASTVVTQVCFVIQ